MDFMPFVHIVGSIVAIIAFGFLVLFTGGWHDARFQDRMNEELSVRLNVHVDDLYNKELAPELLKIAAEKYSSELIVNRISDFCGIIRMTWEWLGLLAQLVVFLWALWLTFTKGADNAPIVWFVVGIAVFSWGSGMIFALTCNLLTGRYPGEAKQGRKLAAAWVDNNVEPTNEL